MSAPKPPNPTTVANTQQQYNRQAQLSDLFGQQTPFGSLAWTADPNAPGGYTATQTLTPQQQQILAAMQTAQLGAGGAAGQLGGQLAGLYGDPSKANIDPAAMTSQLMDWQTKYMQPFWTQQKSNLDAQLANQGITPGSQAYNNAMMGYYSGIGNQENQFFAQSEPLAFSQALQQYQLPMQTFQALQGATGAPGQPNYVPTPTTQPPDYQQAVQQAYQAQLANYGNMMQGLFAVPTALAGGWARGGFKGFG